MFPGFAFDTVLVALPGAHVRGLGVEVDTVIPEVPEYYRTIFSYDLSIPIQDCYEVIFERARTGVEGSDLWMPDTRDLNVSSASEAFCGP